MAEHKTRDVAGILHFLTPQQMAEEIVRLDAVMAGRAPNIRIGRLPDPPTRTPSDEAGRLTALLERLRERCAEAVEQYQGSPERSAEIIRSIELDVAVREYLAPGVPAALPDSMSRDEVLRYYSEYANMVCGEVTAYQKRIRDLEAALSSSGTTVVCGSPAPKPPCAVCGTPYEKHGTAPTCASHDYTDGGHTVLVVRTSGVAAVDGGRQ